MDIQIPWDYGWTGRSRLTRGVESRGVCPSEGPAFSVTLLRPLATQTRKNLTSVMPGGSAFKLPGISARVWLSIFRIKSGSADPKFAVGPLRDPGSKEICREFRSAAFAGGDAAFLK